MNKFSLIIAILLYCFPVILSAQGIVFEQISFSEALVKAKAENKLVFVDCYTSWCGPCKQMSEKVFTQEKVGAYFNGRFVNLKIDMEKGEGKTLASQLNITAYPTFVLVRPDGSVLYKLVGGCDADTFIARIKEGQDENNSLSALKSKYVNGKMTNREIVDYVQLLFQSGEREEAKKVSGELLNKLTDQEKVQPEYWVLFTNYSITGLGSDNFEYLLRNQKNFEKSVGKEAVEQKIWSVYSGYIGNYILGTILGAPRYDAAKCAVFEKQIKQLRIRDKKALLARFRLAQARHDKDVSAMIKNMKIVLPTLREGDLWGYATAFTQVEREGLTQTYSKSLYQLGQLFVQKAENEDLKGYLENFFRKYGA